MFSDNIRHHLVEATPIGTPLWGKEPPPNLTTPEKDIIWSYLLSDANRSFNRNKTFLIKQFGADFSLNSDVFFLFLYLI